jgi:transglutaminase-like putative cysteine protease
MLYDISLRIRHAYDRPAVAGRHALRLTPATLANEQQTIVSSLAITPSPDERFERIDFWGSHTIDIAFRKPHDDIELTLRARVRRRVAPLGPDVSPDVGSLAQEIIGRRSLDVDSPHHFVAGSARAPIVRPVTEMARGAVSPGMSARAIVEAVGRAVHAEMTYEQGATTVETPMADAFAARRGVCQDLTHVMIAGLRGLGIPAGYVSGFLRTLPPRSREPSNGAVAPTAAGEALQESRREPSKERLRGADAMHAWVRAWCGRQIGWVEYDPTNAQLVADGHIVIARGRDYSDVAPVRGVVRTAGEQSSDHAVSVSVLDEA